MADELIIHAEGGTFRVPVEVLEAYRVEDDPEVSGFDFASFGAYGIILKPGEDFGIVLKPGDDLGDLMPSRQIGETEKNLAPRPPRRW